MARITADTTINHFDWDKLIASRTAYIDRIHTSYDNVLGKNNVDVDPRLRRCGRESDRSERGDVTARSYLIATGDRSEHPNLSRVPNTASTPISSSCQLCQSALRWWARVISRSSWPGVINGLGWKRTCSCVNMRRCAA